jgi:RING finger protein 121
MWRRLGSLSLALHVVMLTGVGGENPEEEKGGVESHGGHHHGSSHLRPGHEDHQLRHTLILLLLFVTIVVSQVVLVSWKKRDYTSYMKATLGCLWCIPPLMVVSAGSLHRQTASNILLLLLWLAFSASHWYIYRKASIKPLALSTPRMVNKFLYSTYRLCFGVASFGLGIFILNIFFFPWLSAVGLGFLGQVGFTLLFMGLYFGLMGRDFAEFLSSHIATEMGFASRDEIPKSRRSGHLNVSDQACGICQDLLRRHGVEEEPNYQLSCGHHFHESCVRGWTIVGKKDICPVCAEKVQLSQIFDSNIWAQKSIAWAQLLDALRYLLVWNPLLVLVMQVIVYAFD